MSFADHEDDDDIGGRRNGGLRTLQQDRDRLGLDSWANKGGNARSKPRMNHNGGPMASHSTRTKPQFIEQPVDIDDDDIVSNSRKQPSASKIASSSRGRDLEQGPDQSELRNLEMAQQFLSTITSNIKEIQRLTTSSKKLVDQIGTKKDTHDLRQRLNKNIEMLTGHVRDTAPLFKQLNDLSHLDDNIRQQHSVLKKQFGEETSNFRNLTEEASKKQKLTVRQVKARTVSLEKQAAGDGNGHLLSGDIEAQESDSLLEQNTKRMELLSIQNEITHNESIIAEREEDIREIEVTIREINDIFRDLGVMVVAQGEDIDSIENMVTETRVKTEKATQELTKANKYQAAALGKMLLIIVIVVIAAIVATVVVVVFLKFFLKGFL